MCEGGALKPTWNFEKVEHIESLDNWVEQMDMWCWPSWKIGLLGSAELFGMGISGFLTKLLTDSIGRYKTMIIGDFTTWACAVVALWWPLYPVRVIAILFFGVCNFRYFTMVMMLYEHIPIRTQSVT